MGEVEVSISMSLDGFVTGLDKHGAGAKPPRFVRESSIKSSIPTARSTASKFA
jgi:hypothetical protein